MSIQQDTMNIYFITSQDHKVFGVGQTTRSYEERHKDGDWSKFHNYIAARGEELELLGWWEDTQVVDHDIHKWLKTIPHIGKHAEWFSHKMNLNVLKDKIINKFFNDTPERKIDLVLRPHQQAFVDKAHTDYDDFLLFAKCRAGKSVMTLSHIVDKGHKISLVVSRYTSPKQSWEQDSNNFIQFNNIEFVSLSDKNWTDQVSYWSQTDKQIVLWSTVQGVVRKLDKLPTIDLLVFDESHVGSNATQYKTLRDKLNNTPCLSVSGTAYDLVWEYPERQRFIYSYYEEQLEVERGLYHRPKMNVVLVNYDSDQYQSLFGEDPDAMKNIFAVENEQFRYPELVSDFIHTYFDTQKSLRPSDRLLGKSQHILITLPSVIACDLFADMITSYTPLVVHGNTGNKSVDIIKHTQEYNKTITITRTANVLGVTNKDWDTVINCAEGKSVEFWNQFAFRGGSSDNDWRVIDFCPQRCLESLRQTYVMACDSNPELTEWSFIDFVPVSEWSNGYTELTQDQIIDILSSDVGNTVKLVSSLTSTLDFNKLRDLDIKLSLESTGDNVVKRVVLNDNNGNGKGCKVLVSEKNRGEKSDIWDKIETIQSILEKLPKVMFYMINQGQTPQTLKEITSYSVYQGVTGDSDNVLESAYDYGVINGKGFSNRISQASIDIAEGINKDRAGTLQELSISTGQQQSIPVSLVYELME